MKGEAGKEGGARARKLGGGRICLVDMFGMDIPSRMLSGFSYRTLGASSVKSAHTRCCLVFSLIGLQISMYQSYLLQIIRGRGGSHPVVISTTKYRKCSARSNARHVERDGGGNAC